MLQNTYIGSYTAALKTKNKTLQILNLCSEQTHYCEIKSSPFASLFNVVREYCHWLLFKVFESVRMQIRFGMLHLFVKYLVTKLESDPVSC